MTSVKLSGVIGPAFYDAHKQIKAGEVSEVVAKGGRGSGKSSYLSVELIVQLLRHPDCHAVVLRKVAGTLRTSVYPQVKWAIDALGLTAYFHCTVSPMEITYTPTGQKIFFSGLDDANKIKSIKAPFGAIGICWFEELDQFAGPEEVRKVEQSVFRGGQYALSLKSFNPPAMARNWANRYALEERSGKLVCHSTYKETPPEWLGPRFLADAEHLERTNPTSYQHEYLGLVVGNGTQVFTNLQLRTLDDRQVKNFDWLYNGVDWGWYPDPWAFNRCHYDAAHRTLYIFDELTRQRTPNRDTAKLLLDRGLAYADAGTLYADSSEPKSCADYRAYGLPCTAVEKGPGSVTAGMKWLQSLAAIVIDPRRCPDTAREFGEYEYERSKADGTVLPGYPDMNNHHIDAVRYAMSPVWRRRGA